MKFTEMRQVEKFEENEEKIKSKMFDSNLEKKKSIKVNEFTIKNEYNINIHTSSPNQERTSNSRPSNSQHLQKEKLNPEESKLISNISSNKKNDELRFKKQTFFNTKDNLFFDFNSIKDNFSEIENRQRFKSLQIFNKTMHEDAIVENNNINTNNITNKNRSSIIQVISKTNRTANFFNEENETKKEKKFAGLTSRKSSDADGEKHKLLTIQDLIDIDNYNKYSFDNNNDYNNNKAKIKKRNHIENFISDLENLKEINDNNNYNNINHDNISNDKREIFQKKNLKEKSPKDLKSKLNQEIELANKQNCLINESLNPIDFFAQDKGIIFSYFLNYF